MALLPVRADQPMSDNRQRIDGNFAQTALYPTKEGANAISIVGISKTTQGSVPTDKQQLYYAKDGRDFLSPSTGVTKGGSGQVLKGPLTIDGQIRGKSLVISPNVTSIAEATLNSLTGGHIATSFTVYNNATSFTTDTRSFHVNSSKNAYFYGTATFNSSVSMAAGLGVTGTLSVSGVITARSSGHIFGGATFTAATSVAGGLTVTGGVNVTGVSTFHNSLSTDYDITVERNAVINGNLTNGGTGSFQNLTVANGGSPTSTTRVRPIYIGTGDPPSNLPTGRIYGQYK